MTQKLSPCPWCGTNDHLYVSKCGSLTGDMPDRPYRVVCDHIDHDQVQGPVAYGRFAAIAAWNTPTSTGEGADVETLRAALEPFARVCAAFDYWTPEVMPSMRYPVSGTELNNAMWDCPKAVGNLTEADFRRAAQALATLSTPAPKADEDRLRRVIEAIQQEAKRANDVIRLKRDADGQGRIKVATAMHRIAEWASKALASTPAQSGEAGEDAALLADANSWYSSVQLCGALIGATDVTCTLPNAHDGVCSALAASPSPLSGEVELWKREAANRFEKMVELNLDRAALGVENMQLREALALGERFLNACYSAWAAGEPSHRVQAMLDLADEMRSALDALPAALSAQPDEGEGR